MATAGVAHGSRRRGRASTSSATVATAKSPTFVDLRTTPGGAACDCSIEIEKPGGTKVRIQLRGPELPDLVAPRGGTNSPRAELVQRESGRMVTSKPKTIVEMDVAERETLLTRAAEDLQRIRAVF